MDAISRNNLFRHARESLGNARPSNPAHEKDRDDRSLNWLWRQSARWELTQRVISTITQYLPGWEHSISVAAVGGPETDIRRVWYLVASAAFGRYRNTVRQALNRVSMSANWDISGKACSIEIIATNNPLTSAARSIGQYLNEAWDNLTDATTSLAQPTDGAAGLVGVIAAGFLPGAKKPLPAKPRGADPRESIATLLHRGPEQLTVGGSWPGFLTPGTLRVSSRIADEWVATIPCTNTAVTDKTIRTVFIGRVGVFREAPDIDHKGVASFYPFRVQRRASSFGAVVGSSVAGVTLTNGMPTLPDHGRVITTADKTDPQVQPPAPFIDGLGRASLQAILAQALHDPCHLPPAPPCTRTPAGSGGNFVHAPGDPMFPAGEDWIRLYQSIGITDTRPRVSPDPTKVRGGDPPAFPTEQENFRG